MSTLRQQIVNGQVSRQQLVEMICQQEQKFDDVFIGSLDWLTDGQLVDLTEVGE